MSGRGGGAVQRALTFAAPLLIIAALLGCWQLLARSGSVDPLLLPAPTDVARSLYEDRALLATSLWVTAREVVFGLLIALTAGLLLALVMHRSPALRRALAPLVIGSQAVPIAAIAPLLVAWLGFGIAPKLLIVALVCFFPVTITTLDGLRRIDREQDAMLRSLGAGAAQRLRWLEAPAALPAALSGAKVAVAIGAIAAVFAEYAGSQAGLGHLILVSLPQLETAVAWAAVVLLAALALAGVAIITLLERRLTPWAHPPTKDRR